MVGGGPRKACTHPVQLMGLGSDRTAPFSKSKGWPQAGTPRVPGARRMAHEGMASRDEQTHERRRATPPQHHQIKLKSSGASSHATSIENDPPTPHTHTNPLSHDQSLPTSLKLSDSSDECDRSSLPESPPPSLLLLSPPPPPFARRRRRAPSSPAASGSGSNLSGRSGVMPRNLNALSCRPTARAMSIVGARHRPPTKPDGCAHCRTGVRRRNRKKGKKKNAATMTTARDLQQPPTARRVAREIRHEQLERTAHVRLAGCAPPANGRRYSSRAALPILRLKMTTTKPHMYLRCRCRCRS